MIPAEVSEWLEHQGFGDVISSRPVGGGCINNGARITTTSGVTFFLKTNPNAVADMFACEVEGLEALRVPGGPRVPRPCVFDRDFLLMEDLNPSERTLGYWETFGQRLAALHSHTSDRYGFAHNNYIGSTPQPNSWMEDGYQFFSEQRILYQIRLASQNGYLDPSEVRMGENISTHLPELVPMQPASLLHGDLWGGNAVVDDEGEPAIIDPAAHYGWAEAELAMTALFGGFPAAFYDAYLTVRHLDPGMRERFPIYNLYHLLNHLNLFGEGYYDDVISILRRYGS